jgi:hypothetical protein
MAVVDGALLWSETGSPHGRRPSPERKGNVVKKYVRPETILDDQTISRRLAAVKHRGQLELKLYPDLSATQRCLAGLSRRKRPR